MSLVEARKITKDFPGVRALDGVSFSVRAGEILGLVGENGAGKSTLMRVLSGVYPHGTYGGDIVLGSGQTAQFSSPLEAEAAGIAIIHQELSTFPHLTVAENLFVGHLPKRGPWVDWDRVFADTKQWLEAVGAKCEPETPMGELSVGTQQLIEIAKALSKKSQVLILDEPTSALSTREAERLFDLLKRLKSEGKGIVYISHKMEEIFSMCDRLTVLRDGKSVFEAEAKDISESALIAHMVGRTVENYFPPRKHYSGKPENLLRVENLSARNEMGQRKIQNISFELRAGEILGLAGLLGSGRSEVLRSLFGDPGLAIKGTIEACGSITAGESWRTSRPRHGLKKQNMVFVPEDRKHASIFPMRSLAENLAQTRLSLRNTFRIVNYHEEKSLNEKSIKQLRVKTNSLERTIETLSGGNQQKIILGRALQAHPKIILLDEPTRGVDVGAKYEIYEILFDLAAQGYGLLVVSGELPELMGICDRIGVMHLGRLTRTLDRKDFDARKIMEAAVGSGGSEGTPNSNGTSGSAPKPHFSTNQTPRVTNQLEGFQHQ